MGIFDRRKAFKPFEYPHLVGFKEAIQHSYWTVSHWNYIGDVQDFHTLLSPAERNAVKNAMLAIAQVEVSVKRFWADIGRRFPKAEIDNVGATFADSEVRHADAYSHLLEVLGLNGDFELLLEVPAIRDRVDYLTDFMAGTAIATDDNYALCLTLFSLFIENVSLFGQFAVIQSFHKHKNVLKDIDNVIQATRKEETVHALFGVALIKIIRDENPTWFDGEFWNRVQFSAEKAYKAECRIIDWMFEAGELPFLNKATLKAFIAHRMNESLKMIGYPAGRPFFPVDAEALKPLQWFSEEADAEVSTDFFHKRPVSYTLNDKPVTAKDLFPS